MASSTKSSREKVRKHRQRLRAQGFRPIQIWVPDVRSPGFIKEARRQCLALKKSPQEKEDMAWVESLIDWSQI